MLIAAQFGKQHETKKWLQVGLEELYQQLCCQVAGHKALGKTVEQLEAELAEKQAEIQAGLKRAQSEVLRREAKVKGVFAALSALEDGARLPKAIRADKHTDLHQDPTLGRKFNSGISPEGQATDQLQQKSGTTYNVGGQLKPRIEAKQRFIRQAPSQPRWLQALDEMQSVSRLLAAQAQADITHFELSEALANARSAFHSSSHAATQILRNSSALQKFQSCDALYRSSQQLTCLQT